MTDSSTDKNTAKNVKQSSSVNAWLLLIYAVAAPLSGWRKLKSAVISGRDFAAQVFYPILALTALSEFAEWFYNHDASLQSMLVHAIISFASVFFSYFIIQMIYRVVCSGDILEALTESFGQKFCMVILSTLCIYLIIYNLIPMLEDILVFFPIYTLYLIFKGIPTLLLPRMRTHKYVALVVGLNISVPILLYFLLSKMLQGAMA